MFTKEKRIFIELVSGCMNINCTSPCFAKNKKPSFMRIKTAEQLIKNFKNSGFVVCLYGQGDSSIYPYFREISKNTLNGCIVIITQGNLNNIKYLKKSNITIYIRLDLPVNDKQLNVIKTVDGCFSVISMDNYESVVSTAKKLLEIGIPFMLRSLCNTTKKVPSHEYILNLMKNHKPKNIVRCVLPEHGCNVTTIREDDDNLFIKKCILHDDEKEYRYGSISQWNPVASPEDFCFECKKNDDYRLYYEP